ncbi:uncharacterized protein JCM10292_004629 [Rhodotorula paludigena]|uniref:uncharacterized protein n=1 Tax=Rhodotorula paludigena TaxID=86838 RepID=UPI00317738B4
MPPRPRTRPARVSPTPPPKPSSPSPPHAASRFLAPHTTRMRYVIGRGELGVLSFEPYKSHLLPLWRFKTPDIARESAARLEREFARFVDEGDFVGADMARKFLQMGMTRSLRYANRAGGRKYAAPTAGGGQARTLLPKSDDHPGAAAKRESAAVFREVWERCKEGEEYKRLRREWEAEKKMWEKSGGAKEEEEEEEEEEGVKQEEEEEEDVKPAREKKRSGRDTQEKAPDARAKRRRRVKQESSDEYEDAAGE